MISLAPNFPILIGDKVLEYDQHWYCFLILLKICSVAIAPLVTHDTPSYLGILIEEYLQLFRILYPSTYLKPKHHYMVHYPSQIRIFGPLINSWTMRQESKLSFAKSVISIKMCVKQWLQDISFGFTTKLSPTPNY